MDIEKFNSKVNLIWDDIQKAVLNDSDTVTSLVHRLTRLDLTVRKMATTHIGLLISTAVSCLSDEECYVNIGTWNGYSFFSGLYLNPDKVCVGNDNFTLFTNQYSINPLEKDKVDRDFGNIKELFYKEFNRVKHENSIFVEDDWRKFLNNFNTLTDKKIGFYFYDADHSFDSQYEALEKVLPLLSENPLILVDDTNLPEVRGANEKFLENHSDFEIIYDMKTPCNRYPTWWDGIQIIGKK